MKQTLRHIDHGLKTIIEFYKIESCAVLFPSSSTVEPVGLMWRFKFDLTLTK